MENTTNDSIKPEFLHNRSDSVSVWICQCGEMFTTHHNSGVLEGTDVHFCSKCGVKYDWSDED